MVMIWHGLNPVALSLCFVANQSIICVYPVSCASVVQYCVGLQSVLVIFVPLFPEAKIRKFFCVGILFSGIIFPFSLTDNIGSVRLGCSDVPGCGSNVLFLIV